MTPQELKRIRLESKLTLVQMGLELGFGQAHVWNMENGRKKITWETATKANRLYAKATQLREQGK